MRTVLDLTSDKAKAFFLDEENYCNVKLPSYFKFNDLLKAIDDEYTQLKFEKEIYKTKNEYPSNFENINYKLFSNKDGKYAWRLFQLIHPVLYVSLVNYITNDWDTIKKAFDRFKDNKKIICASIPTANQKQQINAWVKNVEQKSIELALEYEYLFKTDIVDCYGAIYTHSIPWAIHTKITAKDKRKDKQYIGNKIDMLLQGMNYGQTNGIPQGSALMDFIAEMVLGYIDEELTKKLIECDDYRIIRYRDDYRIFTNDIATGKKIVKELSNILADMGMRLNDEKTKDSNDIVVSAIKADKMQVIIDNRPDSYSLQHQLLYIKNLSEQYPNSGKLISKLEDFRVALSRQLNYQIKNKKLLCIRRGGLKKIKKFKHKQLKKQFKVLISILTSIALKNPRCYPVFAAIVGEIICSLCKDNANKKKEIFDLIFKKFESEANSELLYLWLQRIALVCNVTINTSPNKLLDNAKKVYANSPISSGDLPDIWNSKDWLDPDFCNIIKDNDIINKEVMEQLDCVIHKDELGFNGIFSG